MYSLIKIFFLCLLPYIINSDLILFKPENTKIDQYKTFFSYIDKVHVVSSKKYLNIVEQRYDIVGYIYPGINKDDSTDSGYRKFVELTFKKNKPIIVINSGNRYIMKYFYPDFEFKYCNIFGKIFNGTKHNHKTCITKDELERHSFKGRFNTITYKNETYLLSYRYKNIIGLYYSPENIYPRDNFNTKYNSLQVLLTFHKMIQDYKFEQANKNFVSDYNLYVSKSNND